MNLNIEIQADDESEEERIAEVINLLLEGISKLTPAHIEITSVEQ